MTYSEAVAWINALEGRGWRLGLDRMAEFCRRAGLLQGGPQYVHVAGTNGKGSTTAFLQSLMVAGGYRTGAFYSPYVVDYRERIQIGRELISEEDLAAFTEWLIPVAESMTGTEFEGPTKFEFEAGLGFLFWAEKQCDWVALEVGLGGRLDATNVVVPAASVIVSIGLDHVGVLGDSVEKIAGEKAGIVKAGVPVVVGAMDAGSLEVVLGRAEEVGAPVWRYGAEIWVTGDSGSFEVRTPAGCVSGLRSGIFGEMQPHNAALAIAACQLRGVGLSEGQVREGIASAFAPGRFERVVYRGREMVVDGAHNAQAAESLIRTLGVTYPGRAIHLVTNTVSGHDQGAFYSAFGGVVERVEVVPIDGPRAIPVSETVEALSGAFEVRGWATVEEGLAAALDDEGLILVTGSNYLAGEVLRLPGVTSDRCIR